MAEKSNGAIFKEKNGYSKSMKRSMQKHGSNSLEEYRGICKERRKKQRTIEKSKRATAQANKKSKDSKTLKKK